MTLKIGAISQRKSRKLSIMLPPSLEDKLEDYATIHAREHGGEIKINELAVRMIEHFLDRDRGFKRARKQLHSSAADRE